MPYATVTVSGSCSRTASQSCGNCGRKPRVDKSPGLNPNEVFRELERKYQAIADAASAGR